MLKYTMNEYWVLGIVMFLMVAAVVKYKDVDTLRMAIEDYLCQISPEEVIEEEAVDEMDELTELILDFIVKNKEIFSTVNIKNE